MKRHPAQRPRLHVEELERRILYSADAAALLGLNGAVQGAELRIVEAVAPAPVSTQANLAAQQAPAREIVFIDRRVPDAMQLADALMEQRGGVRQFDIVVLDAEEDGIAQINRILAQEQGLAAIHIISHGSDGAIEIGSTRLDAARLTIDADAVARWGQALGAEGDLLLYGCDVARDAVGQAFVRTLASLTGADVAASTDLTGHALFAGNWDLEYRTGQIEASIAASQQTQDTWRSLMAVSVDATSAGSGTNTNGVTISHTTTATGDRLLLVGVAMDANGGPTVSSVTYGGQSLTLVGSRVGGGASVRIEIWRLVNPNVGTSNVVVNLTGNADGLSVGATTFSGVDQTTPLGTFASALGTSNAPSVNVSSAVGDLVYDVVAGKDSGTLAPGAGQAESWDVDAGGQSRGASSTEAGAATVTMSWVKGSALEWAIGGVSVKAAAASAAPTIANLSGDTLAYSVGSAATLIEQGSNATVTDIDSTDFDTGALTVSFAAGGVSTQDVLAIRNQGTGAGQIGLAGANVSYAGTTIGTWAGGTGGANLVVTLNANANATSTAALIRNITYQNTETAVPTMSARTVRFVLSDGDGGISANVDTTVNVTSSTLVVVTSNLDTAAATDGDTSSIAALNANKGTDGLISLREAITAANNTAGADTIRFNIAGTGPHVINLASALPTIDQALIIDGLSEPDYVAGTPVVRIDGAAAGFSGFSIGAGGGGSTIRGLMITGFTVDGINVASGADNVTIADNWIGTAGTGTSGSGNSGVGNSDDGIEIAGSNALILRNVITNNGDEGIDLKGSGVTGHLVQGNIIGLDPDGSTGGGNVDVGIAVYSGSGNTIGGTTVAARNLISKNDEGIEIRTSDNVVQGNYIGTDVTGTLPRGSQVGSGVQLQGSSTNNQVGGTAAGAGNLIAFNAGNGVDVVNGSGDLILGNAIHSNTLIGINLGPSGVAANDANDGDTGANNLQNFPLLTSANSNATGTTIVGTINSNANTTLRIEFFANRPTIADAPNGEGERYLGFITVTTDGSGNASVNTTLASVWVNSGDRISATATVDLGGGNYGDTSEFAVNVTASATGIIVVDTTSDANDGTTTSITILGNNRGADGRISLREAIAAANATPNGGSTDKIVFAIPVTDANHLYYRNNGVGGTFAAPVTTTLLDAAITDFDADYAAGTARSWYRITLGTTNLDVTQAVIIDASTQAGFDAAKGPIIEINAAAVTVGDANAIALTTGASTIRGLVINRAGDNAIEIDVGATSSVIVGNYIGTDVSGTQALGNSTVGSWGAIGIKANNVVVGGTTAADRNLISGNMGSGIELYNASTGALIHGNYIGTTVTGTTALGNVAAGVDIRNNSANNTVGGVAADQGNTIAFNGGDGVSIVTTMSGNVVRGNSIYSNTGLAIDLNNDGVTANDTGDGDAGPNALKNFPVLTLVATSGGTVTVSGSLNTTASATHTIDFYSSPSADGTGFGEGATYIGSTVVITDGSGNASFSNISFAHALPAGHIVTAVTVDLASGNTSEFSRNAVAISSVQATITVDTTSDTSDGDTTSLSTLLANKGADGFVSLREAIIAANNTANGTSADRIVFNIAGTGVHTIAPTAALPTINGAVMIDATTDDSFSANGNRPAIILAGTSAGLGQNGLVLTGTADGSTIRGLVVREWDADGIEILAGSDNNFIVGNYIGRINADGTAGAGGTQNNGDGIYVTGSNNTIGGTTAADRNVISGNDDGVTLDTGATGNVVIGNYIGTDATGTIAVGNTLNAGVWIKAGSNNRIGGAGANEGNLIANNTGDGVFIQVGAGAGNSVLGNSFYSNGGLGIDLGTNGVTNNDAGDPDSGANNLQNFPVLTSANSNAGGTTIVGTINSNANTTLRIEFFANRPTIADAPNGEGERYLGFITVTTDGLGNASVNTTLASVWINSNDRVTATATVDLGGGSYGSTSEFAANVIASSTGIVVVDTTDDVKDGTTTNIATLGTTRGADGRISLREAIEATNGTANGGAPDKIVFAIPAALSGGVHTITLSYDGPDAGTVADALPTITQAVIIDGWSEPDYSGTPVIELNGNGVGTLVKGVTLGAGSDGSTIRGLIVNRFTGTGIEINGSNNHTIQGNWIGLNASGTAASANGVKGIYALDSSGLLIGGTSAAQRNVVSGNAEQGIYFDNVDSSTVSGNYVGTNAAGTGDVTLSGGNSLQSGVFLTNGSDGNVIGGTSASARNVLSGNNHFGFEVLFGSQNNLLQGNYIGTDVTGMVALGNINGGAVFWNAGTGNVFGGGAAGARNVIAGNTFNGVLVGNASMGATVQGNYIGVGADGVTLLGNGLSGVVVEGGSTGTRIGTNADGSNDAAEGNVISGNTYGVRINGSGTTGTVVAGNLIGLAADGNTVVANSSSGVSVVSSAASTTIGGATSASRNVISGNASFGIYFDSTTSSNSVLSNYIGTNAAGTAARANLDGVWIDGGDNNTIGQTGAGNLISGNTFYGVVVDAAAASGNTIRANLIGTDAAGTADLGNGAQGILISNGASATAIGGTTAGQGNTIAFNDGDGIHVAGGTGVAILGNTIHSNTDQGIDLGAGGVTANDVGDADTGANNLQNHPVLTTATTTGAQVAFTGTLNSTASTQFRIEFFASTAQDGSGYGEGQRYLGFANVTTDGSGNATISATLTATVAAGEFISATATRSNAGFTVFTDTSEFGLNVIATAGTAAPVVTATGGTLAYAENDAATAVDSGLSVSDADSTNLNGATVTISANYANGQDLLAFVDQLGITGNWNAGSGVLSLSGTTTVANYQTALRSITYFNGSENPSTLTRTVSFVVNDGMANSATATRNASVTAVNDAPSASNLNVAQTYTEDTPLSLTGIVISDVDSASITATLTLSNAAAGGLNTATSGVVTSTYNAGTGVWSASGALANVNALLAALTFTPASNFNSSFTIATSVSDGVAAPITGSKAISGTPVNDAPTGSVVIDDTTPTQGQALTASNTLADLDGLGSITYQWQRGGVNIAGATGASYTTTQSDVGSVLRVIASYTDGQGTAEIIASADTALVANVNDTPSGAVSIDDGTPMQGQTLTASNTLADLDGLGSVTYQWQRGGVNIAGATSSTYTTTQSDVGTVLRVIASYTDGQGTAESVASADTAAVANVNDAPSGAVSIDDGTPTQGQTLTASNTLADLDGLGSVTYQWQRGGVNIAGATASTYTTTQSDVGSVLRVVASYTDGQGTAESVASANTAAVTNVNDAPTGSVMIDDATPTQGQTLTASNTLADADGLGSISYQWQRGGVNIAGATSSTYTTTQSDVGTVLRVIAGYTDGQGTAESVASANTAAVTNVNDAPTGSVMIDDATPTQGQTLTASNTLADADGLGSISYQWQRGGVNIAGATSSTYTTTQSDVGTVLRVIAGYTDGQGTTESVASANTAAVTNVNDAPTGAVSIDDTTPTQGQTLTASNTLADADGLGSISYQWQRGGVNVAGAIGSTYIATQSDVGSVLRVVASYTDGQGTAESVASAATAAVTNVNDAPTGSVVIDDATPTQGQTLTASNTLADLDGLGSISYQWQRGGVNIAGATSSTYTTTQSDVGTVLRVIAGYTDGQGTAESVASANTAAVTNVNDAPTGSVMIDDATPTQGQTLTASNTLADADGLGSISYQWQRGGVNIAGATSSTYTTTQSDVGTVLRVIAGYTDGQGTAESVTSAATAAVTNVNDAPSGAVSIDDGTPAQGQTLTASNTLADLDGLGSVTYQWQRGGVNIAGATASTYIATQSDVGAVLRVVASYTDGQGTAESVTSADTATVANVNDAPTGSVMIDDATPAQGQTLSASNTLADLDGLGSITYQWQRSGVNIAGATASTYTTTLPDVGSVLRVVATYIDGQGTAESVASADTAAVTNVNDAPSGSVTIDDTTPTQGQTLSASNTLADADGLGTIAYQWQRGGVNIAGASGASYTTTQSDVGTVLRVIASYTDGQGTAESVASADTAAVTNVNDAPTGGVTIDDATPTQGQTLTASNTLADLDGLGSIAYQWQRGGVNIAGATASTYTTTQSDVGTVLRVIAGYTDGQGAAESVASADTAAVTNVNDAPTGGVVIDDATPTQGQTLTASNTLADLDGLGSITYQWQRGGVNIAGATASTYITTQSDVGSVLRVVASSTDGQGTAESVASAATAVVANVNDAPTGAVSIDDTTPTQGQTLTASNTLADADGLGGITYQWQRGGVNIAGASGASYTTTQSDVGTVLRVIASYTDGQGTAESVASAATAVVANVNDASSGSVAIDDTTPIQGQTLAVSNTLADLDGLGSITYQWQRGGVNIAGATASTYTTTQSDVGTVLRVVASYTDGQGTGESVVSADAAVVANLNDASTGSVTIDDTTPTQGQALSAWNTLADADGLGTITYQWQRGGVNLAGATGASYTTTQSDVGTVLRVVASYTDGQGTAETLASGATGAVANVNDAPTGSVSIAGTPIQGQTLTASNSLADADGQGAISYRWRADGSDISGASAQTYVLTLSELGKVITVVASYTDGQGTAEAVTSGATAAVANVNGVPTGGSAAPAAPAAPEYPGSQTPAPVILATAEVRAGQARATQSSDVAGDGPGDQAARSAESLDPSSALGLGATEYAPRVEATSNVRLAQAGATRTPSAPPVKSPFDLDLRDVAEPYLMRVDFMPVVEWQPDANDEWRVRRSEGGVQGSAASGEDETAASPVVVQATQAAGVALTVGTVLWALRAGGLLASLIGALPAWRHVDLLAILPDEEEDRDDGSIETDDQDRRDENAVKDLLDPTRAGDAS